MEKNVFTFLSNSTKQKVKNFFHTFYSLKRFSVFEFLLCTFLSSLRFHDFKKKVCTFYSTFENLEVKKIFCTFWLGLQNLKVRKNPSKKHFKNMPPLSLNTLFAPLKIEKLRFLIVSDAFLFILRNS